MMFTRNYNKYKELHKNTSMRLTFDLGESSTNTHYNLFCHTHTQHPAAANTPYGPESGFIHRWKYSSPDQCRCGSSRVMKRAHLSPLSAPQPSDQEGRGWNQIQKGEDEPPAAHRRPRLHHEAGLRRWASGGDAIMSGPNSVRMIYCCVLKEEQQREFR